MTKHECAQFKSEGNRELLIKDLIQECLDKKEKDKANNKVASPQAVEEFKEMIEKAKGLELSSNFFSRIYTHRHGGTVDELYEEFIKLTEKEKEEKIRKNIETAQEMLKEKQYKDTGEDCITQAEERIKKGIEQL
ncbi:hypothetical protein CVV26_02785 [Candidatus Kuenenbacteria bacterium HGW-Kuenenbacteria-1]|uniref:Uncharacterized protein n=1 Tax=Candidatus Kuenenbacteria bacterium HGW-Kuenenbacteria-1 TaxID=2013812 RepID=A0A2N1UN19_9BACT|nr:MAG: hypothetical protein CVV26_02785 [Candidatus Kuenenbacteria bacterium HGW-Kuenenbacteria-1]